jgi:hypothetical protein
VKLIGIVVGILLAISFLTALYLIVRSFHHQWKWQNKVNENRMRRAVMEEFDIQYEVDEKGFVAPVKRSGRGHRSPM